MPRSRSSCADISTRHHSPKRSPVRRPTSENGSRYEMDLDALGLNSTFESSGLDENHVPKIDVVDTSDIEGPDDFTANLTFYMTADLPLSQIKSRKEAHSSVREVGGDVAMEAEEAQDTTEEGDRAIIEDTTRAGDGGSESHFDSASPTMRANGTTGSRGNGDALSDSSMENDEKVMSYLSALPDTDVQDAFTSTPLRQTKRDTLHVPDHLIPKARSLQATVEDYDTPRKSTQETVVRHAREPSQETQSGNQDALHNQIAELRSRLEQQELASKTRITELETILSYTRSELETTRTENYRYKERIDGLEQDGKRQLKLANENPSDIKAEIKTKENELSARMQEFGEELRLQNLARLQSLREDFEQQLGASEEARRKSDEQVNQKDRLIANLREEVDQLRNSQEEPSINKKLSSVQSQADSLRIDLEKAIADAQAARQDAEYARAEAQSGRVSAPQAQITNMVSQDPSSSTTGRVLDLETQLASLQSQLNASRTEVKTKDQQFLRDIEEHERLEQQLNTAKGQAEGLQTTVTTLRQQLADAHRETSKARTDVERFERQAEDTNEQLEEARREADRRIADIQSKLGKMKELKLEAETKFKDLKSDHYSLAEDHESQMEQVRSKAEDAVRKVGAMIEAERNEKRRLAKELKSMKADVETLRSEVSRKENEEDNVQETEDDASDVQSSYTDPRDVELEKLRNLLRKQAATMKSLKVEISSQKTKSQSYEQLRTELSSLREEISYLRGENTRLVSKAETQRAEFEAVNEAMDERLATMLSKVLKGRTRSALSKRDDQWAQIMERLNEEKEFRGRLLLREWGRQECGIAQAQESQLYRYKYMKRDRS